MANNLIIRPHALSNRDEIRADIEEGANIQEIVDSVWPANVQEFVVMQINGVIVPREWWGRVYPKPNAFLRGVLVFGGGGGRKNTLALVATIAVAIAAPQVAATFGWGTFATAAAAAGLTIAGDLAINAIFKPPTIDVGGANTGPAASQVYSITGQSNQATPYGVVPRVFGRHKIFPRLAATPFIDSASATMAIFSHAARLWARWPAYGSTSC